METVLSALNDYAMWRVLPYQPNCSLEPLIAHALYKSIKEFFICNNHLYGICPQK